MSATGESARSSRGTTASGKSEAQGLSIAGGRPGAAQNSAFGENVNSNTYRSMVLLHSGYALPRSGFLAGCHCHQIILELIGLPQYALTRAVMWSSSATCACCVSSAFSSGA
jgi:hypothetical protein